MAVFVHWCFVCVLAGMSLQVTASDDSKCIVINVPSSDERYDTLTIKDDSGRYVFITNVTVIDLLNFTRCERGKNLNVYTYVIVTNEGCKARLRVCYDLTEPTPPWETPGTDCQIVEVKSTIGNIGRVEVEDNNGRSVNITELTVIELLGSQPCRRGKNLYVFDNVIIGKNGCKAILRACYKLSVASEWLVKPAHPGCTFVNIWGRGQKKVTFDRSIAYMELYKRYSENGRCLQYKDFGSSGEIAWVDNSCLGIFRFCFIEYPSEAEFECDFVPLRSIGSEQDEYTVMGDGGESASIVSIDLIREFHESKGCSRWRTVYFMKSVATATDGCQGRFKICYKSGKSVSGPPVKADCKMIQLKSVANSRETKKVTDDERKIQSLYVITQYEGTKCVRYSNFGLKDGELYVTQNCKGLFMVCLLDSAPPTEEPKPPCVNVRLLSYNNSDTDWTRVTAKNGSPIVITEMTLSKEESERKCKKNSTYKVIDLDQVQVTNGCRGRFRVCYKSKE